MSRKWGFSIISMLVTALVLFPFHFLWLGEHPVKAAFASLLYGTGALLATWGGSSVGSGASRGQKNPPHDPDIDSKMLPRWTKIGAGIMAVLLLVVLLIIDIHETGVAEGVTDAVGFAMLVLTAAAGYKLGYLEQ